MTSTVTAIPSRRAVLAGGSAALVAGAVAAVAAHGAPADDPVIGMVRRLRHLEAEQEPISERVRAFRASLVEKWGEPRVGSGETHLMRWQHDPLEAELTAAIKASDGYTARILDLTDRIMATAPVSVAGLVAKANVALGLWPEPSLGDQYHEDCALAVLNDVVRLLGETRI